MLCQGVEVHLGERVLCLGGAEYDQEGSQACLGMRHSPGRTIGKV